MFDGKSAVNGVHEYVAMNDVSDGERPHFSIKCFRK